MILRHLRYFTVIADEGSVARAAKTLRVAQPALSRQVQQLEKTLGVHLFERDQRGVRLTAAGEVVWDGAVLLLGTLARSAGRAREAAAGRLGTVRVGISMSALNDRRVGAALAALREELPGIECIAVATPSYQQETALHAEEIDIAIGGDVHPPPAERIEELGIRRARLYAEPFNAVILPAGHRLATKRELRPKDLRGEHAIVVDPQVHPIFARALAALEQLGLLEDSEQRAEAATVWNLVAAGRGWALSTASYIETPPAGTVGVPLRELDLTLEIVVRWRAGDRSRVTENVVGVIRRVMSSERGGRAAARSAHTAGSTGADDQNIVRHVEARALRALLAAVEEGSLSDAARRLRLTQSAVSRQIQSLEHAFGMALLVREANGVIATAAGAVVVDDAHAALARFDQVLLQARRVERGYTGVCRVGSVPAEMSQGVLVGALRAVAEQSPAIAVEVQEMLSPRQPAALRNGEIDVGLALALPGLVNDRAIASQRIMEDAFDSVLLPASSALAKRDHVRAEDLRDLPFLFIGRHVAPDFYDAVLQAFEQLGFRPRIDESYSGTRPLWRMLSDGYGWALGPHSIRERQIPNIVAVPIEGFSVPGGLELLWRRSETDANVLAVLDAFRRTPS